MARCKMNKFGKKAAELEAWSELLEHASEQLKYFMELKTDENGDVVTDKDGNEMRVPPNEENDRYGYARYIGWKEVVNTLETMKI